MRIALACVLLAAFLSLGAAPGAESVPPPAFELRVGEAVYPVNLDQPFEIVTPGGERLSAVLRRPEGSYRGERLAFTYPAGMHLEESVNEARTLIKVKSPLHYIAILDLLTKKVDPTATERATVKALRNRLAEKGATFGDDAEEQVTREIGGETRGGLLLRYRMKKVGLHSEVYAFPYGGGVLSVLFETPEGIPQAEETFRKIAGTLSVAR